MSSRQTIPVGHSALPRRRELGIETSSWPRGWAPTDKTIHRTFKTNSFVRGVEFINAMKDLAEGVNHHPDVILTFPAVIVTLTTHDEGMVTMKDLALAEQINRVWDERFAA